MFTRVKRTVKIKLTDADDLAEYDQILNDPLVTVLREIQDHEVETEFTAGGEGGNDTTSSSKFPILIVTYETKELA